MEGATQGKALREVLVRRRGNGMMPARSQWLRPIPVGGGGQGQQTALAVGGGLRGYGCGSDWDGDGVLEGHSHA